MLLCVWISLLLFALFVKYVIASQTGSYTVASYSDTLILFNDACDALNPHGFGL